MMTQPRRLLIPRTRCEWWGEPDLVFANNATHVDPKVGITLYGPRSWQTARHKSEVHVGFVGTATAVAHAREFYDRCAAGIAGDASNMPFPGCSPDIGFRFELRTSKNLQQLITRRDEQQILKIRSRVERFEAMLRVLNRKLELLVDKDHPLDYVVLALPEHLYRTCRSVRVGSRRDGFSVRSLRRAFKALAMAHQKPTQILLETTTGLTDRARKLDHPSEIAWNLFTALHYKADGLPWAPSGLEPATCFVGVSFFRPLGDESTLRTSVVQAFDEHGEGLVIRGQAFRWDESVERRSPHLSSDYAAELLRNVLAAYEAERDQRPARVVIHKTSRFEEAELRGFESALEPIGRYDLVSFSRSSDFRLLQPGRYPPLRGTHFRIGSRSFLYTMGDLGEHGRYPHGHVPAPIEITDHVGDTAPDQLLREILVLTKMNWNSANLGGGIPITLRFSREVGDILREVPPNQVLQRKYKYYM